MYDKYFANPPKFNPDDKVKVISSCNTRGCHGVVVCYINYPPQYGKRYVKVKLNRGEFRNYNENSLSSLNDNDSVNNNGNNKTQKGDSKMAEVSGNYKIALVRHTSGYNTGKLYGFAVFEEDNIGIGDIVLCDTTNGHQLARVENIIDKDVYTGTPVTKEIICKCDFTNYNSRVARRNEKKILKQKMDKMVAEDKDLLIYQTIAKTNPEMAEMLTRYIALQNV